MKKRYMILGGLLALTVFAAGCGKDKEEAPKVEITVTPTPQEKKEELVDMQKSTDDIDAIANVIGTKTATASRFVILNKTGADIASINIRPHTEDEDAGWGDDLVNGKFVLKNNDKAVYYYDKNAKDDEGKTVTSYDVRIFYTDTDRYECYFRDLPFGKIKQLTLRMDGTGDDALPFATYLSEGSTKEYSTLNDVKKRVGMTDSQYDEDSDSEASDSQDSNSDDSSQADPTPTPDGGSTDNPGDGSDNGGDDGSSGEDPITMAESYIGQSLDALKGACGDPSGSDYQDEPETGKTGYHYYTIGDSTFTVSTTVDENGNEIVAGVW